MRGEVRADLEHSKISEIDEEEEEEEEEEPSEEYEEEKEEEEAKRNVDMFTHSLRLNRDLDEASQMLEKLSQSLIPFQKSAVVGDCSRQSSTVDVVKRLKKDWRKSRQSVVSASLSEPDLTQVNMSRDTHDTGVCMVHTVLICYCMHACLYA